MHLRSATLQAYRDGELSPSRMQRISRHLEHCSECRLRNELDGWRISRLTGTGQVPGPGEEHEAQRAEFLSRLRSLQSSKTPLTRPLLELLVGRRAACIETSDSSRAFTQPVTVTIVAATLLLLVVGMVAWIAWQFTGNVEWIRTFFRAVGDMFLTFLSAAGFYLALQVWKGFTSDEPLYRGWFLITASFSCGVAGSIFSKVLANYAGTASTASSSREILEFGLLLGGPVAMVLLACGFFSILRAYHRAGIMNLRFTTVEGILFAGISAYTFCEGFQVAIAFHGGRLSTIQDVIRATNDPLLLLLLAAAILLRNSVRKLGDTYFARSWSAFVSGIFLVSLGNIISWGTTYRYFPPQIASIGWYVWFVAGASYVLAAGFQLEAMGRTATTGVRSPQCTHT